MVWNRNRNRNWNHYCSLAGNDVYLELIFQLCGFSGLFVHFGLLQFRKRQIRTLPVRECGVDGRWQMFAFMSPFDTYSKLINYKVTKALKILCVDCSTKQSNLSGPPSKKKKKKLKRLWNTIINCQSMLTMHIKRPFICTLHIRHMYLCMFLPCVF